MTLSACHPRLSHPSLELKETSDSPLKSEADDSPRLTFYRKHRLGNYLIPGPHLIPNDAYLKLSDFPEILSKGFNCSFVKQVDCTFSTSCLKHAICVRYLIGMSTEHYQTLYLLTCRHAHAKSGHLGTQYKKSCKKFRHLPMT